ncbi:DUF881 domain-containing protein [Aquipuribacter sp. MA13-13]|uniref:DUF881 domain-containing protein n=1 Tax=Aquipuribacter sp. MA13-13 TaxID=3440840 RepID=UPI003EEA9788
MDIDSEPRVPGPGDGPRRRGREGLLRALRQGPGAGVAVVLGAAGLLFAASGSTAQGTDLRDDSVDLASLVGQERDAAEGTTTLVESLRAEVAELEGRTAGADPELDGALAAMGEAAGMQAVTGPAVRVVLDDADFTSRRAAQAGSPDDLVVHQQDVQAVVNALWLGGAEAMMLMDQRVISTSAVRCVGNTLSLQGQPYSPPYVITAVGDPEALLAALEDSANVDEYRRAGGLGERGRVPPLRRGLRPGVRGGGHRRDGAARVQRAAGAAVRAGPRRMTRVLA